MALLNYTTEVPPEKSVAEIVARLQAHGAEKIMLEYDAQKKVSGLAFVIQTAYGSIPFRLPVNIERTFEVLRKQYDRGKAPRSVMREGQGARVAWRILKTWIDAQLAMVDIDLVTLDRVMLPYALVAGNQTVYDVLISEGGMQRLLGSGPS